MTSPIRMVSVPVEPTEAMIEAGNRALSPWIAPAMHAAEAYRAMLSAAPAPEGGAADWSYDLTSCPKSEPFLIAYADGDVRMGHYLDNSKSSVPWEGIRPLFGAERWDAKIIAWAKRPALAAREEAPAEAGATVEIRFPELNDHLIRMASAGNTGSLAEWCAFLDCLRAALRAQPPAREDGDDRPIEASWTDGVTHAYVNLSAALSAERQAWRQKLGIRIASVRYLDVEVPPAREDAQPVAKPAPFDQGGIGHAMYQAFNAYLADYVLSTDGADHEPTPFERDLIEDFFAGLMAEEAFFGPVRALYDTHPAPDALREALTDLIENAVAARGCGLKNDPDGIVSSALFDTIMNARQALAALQAEQKGGA